MNSLVTTAEVASLFVLCLSFSFGIAYAFLKTAVMLTTNMNRKKSGHL